MGCTVTCGIPVSVGRINSRGWNGSGGIEKPRLRSLSSLSAARRSVHHTPAKPARKRLGRREHTLSKRGGYAHDPYATSAQQEQRSYVKNRGATVEEKSGSRTVRGRPWCRSERAKLS